MMRRLLTHYYFVDRPALLRLNAVVGRGNLHAFLVIGVIADALAGCVTASNTLSVDQLATYRLSGVNVAFAPDVIIMWGDGERAYAASKGQPATESDVLAKTP